jgi:hypothetical protein
LEDTGNRHFEVTRFPPQNNQNNMINSIVTDEPTGQECNMMQYDILTYVRELEQTIDCLKKNHRYV